MKKITTYSALLGQIIGSLRKQQGLEQQDVAEALGISQASYSRLEGGKALWTIDQLMAASECLDASVQWILEILERRSEDLNDAVGVTVIPAGRANSRGAGMGEQAKNLSMKAAQAKNGGEFLVGAALGAILATLIARSK